MKAEEKIAESYLKSCGFETKHEPDGNVTPDFLLNSTIGVEVRRLNQQHQNVGRSRGLEEQRIPLIDGVNRELEKYSSVPNGNCYWMTFRFARNTPKPNEIRQNLKKGFKAFEAQNEALPFTFSLSKNSSVSIASKATFRQQKYKIGIEQDWDSGGWVEGIYVEAISHAIAEKKEGIKKAVKEYSRWWLVLVDYINHWVPDEQATIVAKLSKPECFEKVIIIDHNGNKRFEI